MLALTESKQNHHQSKSDNETEKASEDADLDLLRNDISATEFDREKERYLRLLLEGANIPTGEFWFRSAASTLAK